MKTSSSFAALALTLALVLPVIGRAQSTGLSGTTGTGSPLTGDAGSGNDALFRALDTNNDGTISREEFRLGMSNGAVPGATTGITTNATTPTGTVGTSGTGTSGTGTSNAGTSGTGTSSAGTSGTGTSNTGSSSAGTSGTGTSSAGTTGAASGATGVRR